MAGTNDSFCFSTDCYKDYDFGELPKGVMFSLAMNPYNGLVVARYNRSNVAVDVLETLNLEMRACVDYLSESLDYNAGFDELADFCNGDLQLPDFEPCPFCGQKPVYEDAGYHGGSVTCCGGRLRFDGFENRAQAVREWNNRAAFRVKVA